MVALKRQYTADQSESFLRKTSSLLKHSKFKKARPQPQPSLNTDSPKQVKDSGAKNIVEWEEDEDGFRWTKKSLFSKHRLCSRWEKQLPIGTGLHNLGNTCFLNSVLQCLTYTPPFANFLLFHEHRKTCSIMRKGDFCMLCTMQHHVTSCFSRGNGGTRAMAPDGVVSRLKHIAKHMRRGRQEDAHEFMRYVVDAIQRSCLLPFKSTLEPRLKETTLIHQIFGGYLRSQVECLRCRHKSNTFEPMLDISLDVHSTLMGAFQTFTRPDRLTKANQYQCEKCKVRVDALKRMSIHRAPMALTVQLKRFAFDPRFGYPGKVGKQVVYDEEIDISPYMSEKMSAGSLRYKLYAVLVHQGSSCRLGHYYCYVKSPSGKWYEMDDESVQQVSLKTVLSQQAYILFYLREDEAHTALQGDAQKNEVAKVNRKPSSGSAESKVLVNMAASPNNGPNHIHDTASSSSMNGGTPTKNSSLISANKQVSSPIHDTKATRLVGSDKQSEESKRVGNGEDKKRLKLENKEATTEFSEKMVSTCPTWIVECKSDNSPSRNEGDSPVAKKRKLERAQFLLSMRRKQLQKQRLDWDIGTKNSMTSSLKI
ncbi:uncharacterized protein VTP21DRAFT_6790 [Calcarisporiella thermophila]|uniref:uncharacterized protein n=1 Tax=Calcarisporiella thermophila TaxID=911321 RepID=UPI003743A69F